MRRLFFLLCLTSSTPVLAVDYQLILGRWNYDITGTTRNGNNSLDLQRDLGQRAHQPFQWRAQILDIGSKRWWVPDWVQVGQTNLSSRGEQVVNGSMNFGGLTVLGGQTRVQTEADFTDSHATIAYRSLGWSGASLWTGISLHYLSGALDLFAPATNQRERQEAKQFYPQTFGAYRIPLSYSWHGTLSNQYVAFQGNRATEITAMIDGSVYQNLGVAFGWQQRRYDVETGRNSRVNARFEGPFFQLRFNFEASPREAFVDSRDEKAAPAGAADGAAAEPVKVVPVADEGAAR
jgi:hypothetical protein